MSDTMPDCEEDKMGTLFSKLYSLPPHYHSLMTTTHIRRHIVTRLTRTVRRWVSHTGNVGIIITIVTIIIRICELKDKIPSGMRRSVWVWERTLWRRSYPCRGVTDPLNRPGEIGSPRSHAHIASTSVVMVVMVHTVWMEVEVASSSCLISTQVGD